MTPNDLDTVARTLYGEARGEPIEGKIAVAWVIKNRADNASWWGTGLEGVCKKPFQFSCWNKNDPNRDKLIAVHFQDSHFRECLTVAAGVLSGNVPDPTGSADHYHTTVISPPWSRGKEPTVTIGAHHFYRLRGQ